MHGRPLTTGDYSLGFSLTQEFLSSPRLWPTLFSVYKEYWGKPDALLAATVHILDEPVSAEVLNNLPIPDYDDTGFQPRKGLEADLKRKILGRHPVITVLGDGGNGKTALTLQTLYGLLHSNDHDFDAFIWVFAKSNRLTTTEITRIHGAITTSLGIFEDVAEKFEPGSDNPIDRVRRLLEQNRVLLAIDNLETVLDENLMEFASDVPGQSKIVFTSRVPLGGDLSVQVPEFSESESLPYLRRLIEAYDIDVLRGASDEQLRRHLNRLANKPLLVKWFAIGVSTGLNPDRITANPEIALRFCMENVFEKLSGVGRDVLSIMAIIPQSVSSTVIQHISLQQPTEIEAGLAELIRFGLVERSDSSNLERLWRLKPFARAFITRVMRLSPDKSDEIRDRHRTLNATYQEERGRGYSNPYESRFFTVRSQSEAIAARRLRHAHSLAFKDRFDQAIGIIDELKISIPEYFEVYRTLAFIQYRQGDVAGAAASYEAAFDLAPDQPQLRFFYGEFLMRAYGDCAGAREQFEAALEIDSSELVVLREAARSSLFLFDFDAAQKYITSAWNEGFKSAHDEVVFHDLQSQLYIRQAEHKLNTGDPTGAARAVEGLHGFLKTLRPDVVDATLIEHLWKVLNIIDALKRHPLVGESPILDSTAYFVRSISQTPLSPVGHGKEKEEVIYGRSGELKPQGRTPTFGFIRDTFGVDTYVHRNSVSATLWSDMCAGRTVRFDIHSEGNRTWAESVALL